MDEKSYNKTVIDFNFGIYLPEKLIFTQALRPAVSVNMTFSGR